MNTSTPHTWSGPSGCGAPDWQTQFRKSSPRFFANGSRREKAHASPAEAALLRALEQVRTGREQEISGLFGAWMQEQRVRSEVAGILGTKFGIALANNADAEPTIAEIKAVARNMGIFL